MTIPTLAGQDIYSARITLPRTGVWSARVVHGGDAALSGRVELEADGLELSGTVQRSGIDGAQVHTLIQGGSGGLTQVLPARFWRGSTIALVLADLMRETGEALAPELTFPLASLRWSRAKSSGGHELTRIASKLGTSIIWRVQRDGSVWIGAETWETVDLAHVELERHPQDAHVLIAPEGLSDLAPGTILNGERIDSVVHTLEPSQLRTEVFLVE